MGLSPVLGLGFPPGHCAGSPGPPRKSQDMATLVLVRCAVRESAGGYRDVPPFRIPVEDRLMSMADFASKVKSGLENWLRQEDPDRDPGPTGGQRRMVEVIGLRWCGKLCGYDRELDYYMSSGRWCSPSTPP